MRKTFLCLSIAATTLAAASVAYANSANDQSFCQLKKSSGQTVDLTRICGQSPMAAPAAAPKTLHIDPNQPANIIMVGSDQPSALWNSVPNLPNAPKAGATSEGGFADGQIQRVPETAETPSEDAGEAPEPTGVPIQPGTANGL
jgi:hypothetical protein